MAKQNHYHRVEIRVSQEDWKTWKSQADEAGLTVADVIRMRMRGLAPAPIKAA